jgi:hypothetical protein
VVGDLLKRRPTGFEAPTGVSALQMAFCHLKAYEAALV